MKYEWEKSTKSDEMYNPSILLSSFELVVLVWSQGQHGEQNSKNNNFHNNFLQLSLRVCAVYHTMKVFTKPSVSPG